MEKLKFYLNWILRFILASTFLYAAISKLVYPNEFFNNIRNYQLTPALCPKLGQEVKGVN